MATLRDIRRRINSVKSTQQITKAMKMVAAAKLRRAQQRIVEARPYAFKLREGIASFVRGQQGSGLLPRAADRATGGVDQHLRSAGVHARGGDRKPAGRCVHRRGA